MDPESRKTLFELLQEQRVASLGTLLASEPFVSMVLFSAAPDGSSIDLHVSRMALHTQGLLDHGVVGLMIAEPERDSRNPQTLARLSLQGRARQIPHGGAEYEAARSAYLEKYPTSALNFELGDFMMVRITPRAGRLITGFGRIFDLTAEDLTRLAASPS